jgi:hypothetical protein
MSRKIVDFMRLGVVLSLLLGATYVVWGQGNVTSGTIVGDVTDSTGAVLPAAKVTVQNQGTGVRREVVTDANGHFVVSQVPAARYEIAVTASRFKESVIHGVQVNVDATAAVKVQLEVGGAAEKVEVSAEAVQAEIDPTKTEVSNVVQEVQVRELPLNQRSFTALVTQQPGMVLMTNSANVSQQSPVTVALGAQGSMISANGMISQSMAYLVDGININTSGFGAPGTAAGGDVPGVEGIQEFKVLNQNYSAVYGGSAGAVVSFATRSGTNQFHGSAYEFFRNDVMDAREFFNDQGKKNPYRRNQFGATFGGPIKNEKTFFFINYEALRSRLTTTNIGTVPDLAARNGGLGGTSGFQVFDPWGNPVALSPGVKAILTMYPLPNGLDFGNGIAEVNFPNYQPVNQQYGLVRFDQVLSSKDTLMGRYSVTDAGGFSAYNLPTWQFNKQSRIQGLALKWTRTISNNLVSTLSTSFQRSFTLATTAPRVPVPPEALMGNPSRHGIGVVTVGVSGGGVNGSVSNLGNDTLTPVEIARNTFPVTEDLIYSRGSHTLKIGGQFMPMQWNTTYGIEDNGLWDFNSFNDMLAGYPSALFIRKDGAISHAKYRSKQFAWYVEDTWRIKPSFTVTLGLRHEFRAPFFEEIHTPSRLGNTISRDGTYKTGSDALNNPTLKQFAPRIGLAYDPFHNGKTVIRTGFGMFYDQIQWEGISNQLIYNVPNPGLVEVAGSTAVPIGSRGTPTNPTIPPIPFPLCPALPNGESTCTSGAYVGFLGSILLPVRPPTSLQWNLQIERELPGGLKVSATYAGAHSYNISRQLEGNSSKPCSFDSKGNPYFGPTPGACGTEAPAITPIAFSLYTMKFDAAANYNAGTFAVSRMFSSGITFNTSYTFAKAMSDVDTYNSGLSALGNAAHSADPLNPKEDWSESMFSIRHRFIMNGLFELPFGKGKMFAGDANGIKQVLLGGWAFHPLMTIQSGIPFSILTGTGVTPSNVNDFLNSPDRPNMTCSSSNARQGGITQYFNPLCFSLQDPGYLGNEPRNSVRGPGFTDVDLSLTKQFKTSEKTNLEFRAEAFNIVNHPSFNLPVNQLYVVASPHETNKTSCNLTPAQAAIYSCDTQAGLITGTVGTPRQLQFALKFTF